ncbi:MAG: hypothetical protein R3E79_06550 [Caldilineaceae bacterium]
MNALLIGVLWLLVGYPAMMRAAVPGPQRTSVTHSTVAQVQTGYTRLVPLLITPLESTRVQLQMHTADFHFDDSTGNLRLTVAARYRLKNSNTADPATVVLRVAPMVTVEALAPVESLTLLANDQPLELVPTDARTHTAQLQIGADARTDLQLAYTVNLQQQQLPLLEYVVVGLQRWSGAPSLRVSVTLPATIPQASWLRIGPEGWHFSAESAERIGAKWLYDGQQPDAPFVLQFIHPALWSQLDPLAQRIQTSTAVADFLQLGALYQQLITAATAENASSAIRERFYAQALAVYTTGLDRLAPTAPPDELATLYAGLATLYRSRIAQGAGSSYAAPLVEATQAALNRLSTDDSRRRELTQWLSDGLQVLLADAQQRQAWQNALTLVDQLSALPSDVVDSVTLAKTKRLLLVQQALQLLEQDNRAAAVALAGDELRDSRVQPPPSADALFSRWEVTVTVSPQQQQVEIVGKPIAERSAEATAAFSSLVKLWQMTAGRRTTVATDVDLAGPATPVATTDGPPDVNAQPVVSPLRVVLQAPTSAGFADLVKVLPPRADWALLNSLLQQLQPTVDEKIAWLNRQWTITQAFDLRTAGEQWQAMATTLERQADQFEQESVAFPTTDAVGAENALQARVQAANYRSAAHQWQRLFRDSWVVVQFNGQTGLPSATRTWLLTAATPSQQLTLVAQPSSLVSVVSVTVLALVALFLLTTFLWWLL